MLKMINEQQWISNLREGSETAFESLFNRYGQKIYRFSLAYLKSNTEAEEIVQNVFLKLWENKERLRNETSFQSYLFTIAYNEIRKRFNKKALEDRFKTEIVDWLAEDMPELESKYEFELIVNKLEQLINQMPERRREIFIKRKKEGQAVKDIATEMNISPKTVENQITEAMNFLRTEFGNDRISDLLLFYLFFS